MTFFYTAYDLLIDSSLRLDELCPGEKGEIDVTIRVDNKLEQPPGAIVERGWFRSSEDWLLLSVDGVADFLIANGSEITICPAPGADERDVRAYLLGSCLAALLQQRDLLTLHAAAVEIGQSAVLFSGESGSGKSTLLQAFLQHGYRMLADDVSGVTFDKDGRALVLPAIPRCKLWDDAIDQWEIDTRDMIPVHSRERKYAIVTESQFVYSARSLSNLFVLRPRAAGEVRITPIDGVKRIGMLLEHTFRPQFLDGLARRRQHLRQITSTAQQARFYMIDAPRDRFSPSEIVDAILAIGVLTDEHNERLGNTTSQ